MKEPLENYLSVITDASSKKIVAYPSCCRQSQYGKQFDSFEESFKK